MKWVKRFAAGALAAALSLALLCGCSDSTKLENVEELEFKKSLLYNRVYFIGAISDSGWALKGVDQANGKTFVAVSKEQAVSYVGTEQSGVMKVAGVSTYGPTDKNGQYVSAGIYEADRKTGTYRSVGKMGAVEQVITSMLLSYGRDLNDGHATDPNSDNLPTKMEAASATRGGESYYVEKAEYACGTAVIYYLVNGTIGEDTEVKYIDIYLPGQKTPQARYKVTDEGFIYKGNTALVKEYGNLLSRLDKVD